MLVFSALIYAEAMGSDEYEENKDWILEIDGTDWKSYRPTDPADC